MASKWTKKEKLSLKFKIKDIGFSIDIQTNLKEVNFLDVTLNLENGTYRPYKKPNDKLLCIHSSSNHPPQIIKQLPNSISERVSKNYSNQEIFNTAKVKYEDALKKSGYSVNSKYTNNKSENEKPESETHYGLTQPLANPFQQMLQRQNIFQEATSFTKVSTAIQLKSATVA